jgi:uncharacterized protein (DUF2336 family)
MQTIDAEYLLNLARTKSSEGRRELAAIIADLFENQSETLTDRERKLMFDIMHSLVHEVEISVRKSFVDLLDSLPDTPPGLLRDLANDEIDVAYPLLTKSSLLRDADLIDIIRARTREHQLAIALRSDVSEDVTDALVETEDESVIEKLLHNQNARISEATMAYLVEQSRRVDTFQEPLLKRHDLKENLAERMFMWVSAALRQYIVERYELDSETIDALLEQAARQGFASDALESPASVKTRELVAAMREDGAVTPGMLVAALSDGEVPLFMSLFAELVGISDQLTSRIVFEEGGEGLAIACKSVDMSEMQFSLIFRLSRRARPAAKAPMIKKVTHELLELYGNMSQEAALKVVRRWQRGSDFLAAIRELERHG